MPETDKMNGPDCGAEMNHHADQRDYGSAPDEAKSDLFEGASVVVTSSPKLDVNEARRLKALEDENRRLKAAVADLTLDNRMLKDMPAKKW